MQSTNAICQQNWKIHITQQETGGHDVQPISNIFVKIWGWGRGSGWELGGVGENDQDYWLCLKPPARLEQNIILEVSRLSIEPWWEEKHGKTQKLPYSLPVIPPTKVFGRYVFGGPVIPHQNVLGSLGFWRATSRTLQFEPGDFRNNIHFLPMMEMFKGSLGGSSQRM